MSVAKIIELSAASPDSFEDAVRQGIAKASQTIHGIREAWLEGQKAIVEDGKITEYRVNLKVTFLVD